MILPSTGADGAKVLAERLRSAVEEAAWPHRAMRVSVGVSTVAAPETGASALLAAADEALYRAKRTGGNRVVT